jgi:integrase
MAIRKVTLGSGDVRWMVDYYDENGVRHRIKKRRKKDADALNKRLLTGESLAPAKRVQPTMTFGQLAPVYLDYLPDHTQLKPSTIAYQRSVVYPTLVGAFGRVRLTNITRDSVLKHRASRIKAGRAIRTANGDVQQMKTMLDYAIRQGWLKDNAAAGIPQLKEQKREKRWLRTEEIEEVLSVSRGSHLYGLILAGLHTGMRKSELFGLTWGDVNFEQGYIRVLTPKNYTYRYVDLTAALRADLVEARAMHEKLGLTHGHVFTYMSRPITHGVKHGLDRVCQIAGVEPFGLHTLRHTFASHLAMAGVPQQIIQMILGHEDPRSTEKYIHLSPDSYRNASAALPYAGDDDEDETEGRWDSVAAGGGS